MENVYRINVKQYAGKVLAAQGKITECCTFCGSSAGGRMAIFPEEPNKRYWVYDGPREHPYYLPDVVNVIDWRDNDKGSNTPPPGVD